MSRFRILTRLFTWDKRNSLANWRPLIQAVFLSWARPAYLRTVVARVTIILDRPQSGPVASPATSANQSALVTQQNIFTQCRKSRIPETRFLQENGFLRRLPILLLRYRIFAVSRTLAIAMASVLWLYRSVSPATAQEPAPETSGLLILMAANFDQRSADNPWFCQPSG